MQTSSRVLIYGAILLVFSLNLAFIAADRRTFSYDDSWYAEHALRLLDAVAAGGLPAGLDFLQHQTFSGQKAPLVILLPLPLLLIFGRHDFVFPLANALCLAAAGAYFAALARRWLDAPVVAVLIVAFGLMPLTALTTHTFFVEVLLTMLVLMFIYHAQRSQALARRRHALLAGVAGGLGMLAKVTFPVFVIGVAGLLYARVARRWGSPATPLLLAASACLGPALALVGRELGWPHAAGFGIAVTLLVAVGSWIARPAWQANVVMASGAALWIGLLWYLDNWRPILRFAVSNSFGEISRDYGSANLLDLGAIGAFWLNNVNAGFGALFAAAFAVVALLWLSARLLERPPARQRPPCGVLATSEHAGLRTRPASRGIDAAATNPLLLILAWALPAALVFTLGRNRTTRFLLPVIPALVLAYGVLLQSVVSRARVLGLGLGALHAALAVLVYASLAFGGPTLRWRAPSGVEFVFSGPALTTKGPATRERYALEDVVFASAALAASSTRNAGENALAYASGQPAFGFQPARDAFVMLLSDSIHVNPNTLTYTAVKLRAPVLFGLIPYGGTSAEPALAELRRADLLAYQTGGPPGLYPEFTNRWGPVALERIRTGELPGWRLRERPEIALHDGSVMRFIERTADAPSLSPCFVSFLDGSVALVGYRLEVERAGLRLTTCWLKLAAVQGRFVLAAHLIDADRTYSFNADHSPQGGEGALEACAVGRTVLADHVQPIGAPEPEPSSLATSESGQLPAAGVGRAEWTRRATDWAIVLYDVEKRRDALAQPEGAWGVRVGDDGWVRLALPASWR